MFGFGAHNEQALPALRHEADRIYNKSINGIAKIVERKGRLVLEIVSVVGRQEPGDIFKEDYRRAAVRPHFFEDVDKPPKGR